MWSGRRALYKQGNGVEYIQKDNITFQLIVRDPASAPADFELNENETTKIL